MNQSEKRRMELLEQTRNLYSDRRTAPAVHPRYGAVYNKLYADQDGKSSPGTFGIRVFLCFMLFAAYVTMDTKGIEVKSVGSERIVQEITTDVDVAEVWKNL